MGCGSSWQDVRSAPSVWSISQKQLKVTVEAAIAFDTAHVCAAETGLLPGASQLHGASSVASTTVHGISPSVSGLKGRSKHAVSGEKRSSQAQKPLVQGGVVSCATGPEQSAARAGRRRTRRSQGREIVMAWG